MLSGDIRPAMEKSDFAGIPAGIERLKNGRVNASRRPSRIDATCVGALEILLLEHRIAGTNGAKNAGSSNSASTRSNSAGRRDSITWRRFCRIPLDRWVPHPTTLMKLTTRCGPAAEDGLNEALLAKATEAKVLRTTKLRADTTVVPSNVSHPSDSGLLAKAIRRIAATGKRIQAAGGATHHGPGPVSCGGQACTRYRFQAAFRAAPPDATRPWRRSGAQPSELADLAETAATDAERLLTNAKHALRRARAKATAQKAQGEHDAAAGRRRGRLAPPSTTPVDLVTATRKITAQTRQRLAGQTPDGSTRRVSLHDPDARPIAKGRLGKPVEFGHKAQLVEGDDGVIVDHNVERGNPADAPQLAPAVDRVRTRAGRPPRTVTADRSYGEKAVEDDLRGLGVRNVVIPRKGKPSAGRRAAEHRPAFRRTIKWRTGVEGRISALKRGYGWDRTRIDSTEGAQIWVGHGVLAHNLVKISTLAA